MTKKWELNEKGILNSLDAVFKYQDINKLTKDAYNFTMILSGFIAHYNINGFKDNYADLRDFKNDLLNSDDISNAEYYINDSYFSEGEQAEYYAKKTKILQSIPAIIEKYADEIDNNFTEKEKQQDLAHAKYLTQKWA